jgi:hypothetical protein
VTLSCKFLPCGAGLLLCTSVTYSGIALNDLKAAHRAIVRAERVIVGDIEFLGPRRDVVAMKPLGFIKGLDAAYAPTEMLARMNAYWDEPEKSRTPGPLPTSRAFTPNPESELPPCLMSQENVGSRTDVSIVSRDDGLRGGAAPQFKAFCTTPACFGALAVVASRLEPTCVSPTSRSQCRC